MSRSSGFQGIEEAKRGIGPREKDKAYEAVDRKDGELKRECLAFEYLIGEIVRGRRADL